jgi:hypothetical protein
MSQIHTRRSSLHPLVDTVWATQNISDGVYSATPDGSWDLIVLIQSDGSKQMMITGQATKPMDVPYQKDTSSVVISFVRGAYVPAYKGKLVDSFEILPNLDAEHFILCGKTFEFPSYETAEEHVEALIDAGLLLADPVIYAANDPGTWAASKRSYQRHFAEHTGMSEKSFEQIERAKSAVRQLQDGKNPRDVAADVGYSDQPHLARSLKKIMGVKPSGVDDIHKL